MVAGMRRNRQISVGLLTPDRWILPSGPSWGRNFLDGATFATVKPTLLRSTTAKPVDV
jgi:hypothetical protein